MVGCGGLNLLEISVSVPHSQLNAFERVALVQLEDKAMVEVWPTGIPVDGCPLKASL